MQINGNTVELIEAQTLDKLLQSLGISIETGGVAVSLNEYIVPRSGWKAQQVTNNDRIEIIHAVQGG